MSSTISRLEKKGFLSQLPPKADVNDFEEVIINENNFGTSVKGAAYIMASIMDDPHFVHNLSRVAGRERADCVLATSLAGFQCKANSTSIESHQTAPAESDRFAQPEKPRFRYARRTRSYYAGIQ